MKRISALSLFVSGMNPVQDESRFLIEMNSIFPWGMNLSVLKFARLAVAELCEISNSFPHVLLYDLLWRSYFKSWVEQMRCIWRVEGGELHESLSIWICEVNECQCVRISFSVSASIWLALFNALLMFLLLGSWRGFFVFLSKNSVIRAVHMMCSAKSFNRIVLRSSIREERAEWKFQ